MVESMAATAERIKAYEHEYGRQEVEKFLDAVLAIQEHIDPSLVRNKLSWSMDDMYVEEREERRKTDYDDLWGLDNRNKNRSRRVFVRKEVPATI